MENGIEAEVLEEVSKNLVITEAEIIRFLQRRVTDPRAVTEAVTKSLYRKGMITYVTPIGQTCYAITQKGMRAVRG